MHNENISSSFLLFCVAFTVVVYFFLLFAWLPPHFHLFLLYMYACFFCWLQFLDTQPSWMMYLFFLLHFVTPPNSKALDVFPLLATDFIKNLPSTICVWFLSTMQIQIFMIHVSNPMHVLKYKFFTTIKPY